MSLSIEQEVIESIRILPEDKQKQVLEYVKNICEEDQNKPNEKKIWEKIDEIVKDIPEKSFQGMPTDGSLNHDHYLYGSPKRETK
ncbi:MAG: hypothetical protein M3405_13785 [Acidobacteriota bacterium]|nr:hypothetical protein [Acidobacteriota bacterium]